MAKAKRLPGKTKAPTRTPIKAPVKRRTTARKKSNAKRSLYIAATIILLCVGSVAYWLWSGITDFRSAKVYYYNQQKLSPAAFADSLKAQGFIRSALPLKWAFEKSNVTYLQPGLYEIKNGVTAYGLVSDIQNKGVIKHLKIEIECYRQRKNILAGIAKQADLSTAKLKELMSDEDFLDSLGGLTLEDRKSVV